MHPAIAIRGSAWLEAALVELSQALWWPVVGLIGIAVAYTLVQLGAFLVDACMRLTGEPRRALVGDGSATAEAMELRMAKELEGLRICSRVSPMLGLIATMIPLGPALGTVTTGVDDEALARLGDSFASVILALMAASIAFAIHTVRRRWLTEEYAAWLDSDAGSGTSHA